LSSEQPKNKKSKTVQKKEARKFSDLSDLSEQKTPEPNKRNQPQRKAKEAPK